ncbi:amino acid/amide ABC transporter substrate-binding protein (HAAT family) [Mesorhizobium sp. J18]|uniref:ABC transporter substrate-binding protein n=1 Tax=Mesorhizobium sp. J18 TaxID=935263 RepID=UPI0011991575|nr:ABC transporter substrate-binding protein [Mesorhizobium sp. J18]TWH01181.1 amino acid/amide ABC transporter substrate-binding protein (HAAT family) [Mesorhizobium sp. J18]
MKILQDRALAAPIGRRQLLKAGAASAAMLAMPGIIGRALADDELKIGWVRPLTGPLASSFEALYAAGDIALEEINSAGGILGRKLVKVEVDDAGAPANEPIAMRELINQDVKFVVGPVGSSQTLASLAVSTPAKIIQSGYITASEGGAGTRYPYHYQCVFTVETQAVIYAEHLAEKTRAKKIGILVEDSAAGTSVLAACKEELPARGLTIVGEQISPLRSNDLTPFLRSLRSAGAEALCAFVSNNIDVTQFFVGLQRLGWQPPVVGHIGLVFAAADKAVPDAARYPDAFAASYKALTFTDSEQPDERVRSYIDKILGLGLPPAALPPAATSPYYDFLHVLKHAAEETESLDTDEIKAYLDQLTGYKGLFGEMKFTAENHTAYGPEAAAMAQVFVEDPGELVTASQGLFRPRG